MWFPVNIKLNIYIFFIIFLELQGKHQQIVTRQGLMQFSKLYCVFQV